jgi:hypothetical protein
LNCGWIWGVACIVILLKLSPLQVNNMQRQLSAIRDWWVLLVVPLVARAGASQWNPMRPPILLGSHLLRWHLPGQSAGPPVTEPLNVGLLQVGYLAVSALGTWLSVLLAAALALLETSTMPCAAMPRLLG